MLLEIISYTVDIFVFFPVRWYRHYGRRDERRQRRTYDRNPEIYGGHHNMHHSELDREHHGEHHSGHHC